MNTQQHLQNLLENMVQAGEARGVSLLCVHKGEELFYAQAGMANAEENRPMQRDTICRVYSMTKPITAFAAFKLAEMGKLDFTDCVAQYLPAFGAKEQTAAITVQHLLNMTSGLVYGGGDSLAHKKTDALIKKLVDQLDTPDALTTREFADALSEVPLAFTAGEKFAYGLSADVLGAVIEVAAEQPLDQFLYTYLFAPLQMQDTGFFVTQEKQHRLAHVYEYIDGAYQPYAGNYLGICNDMAKRPAFLSGGAGLVSTIDDYAKFAAMLLAEGQYGGQCCLQPAFARSFVRGHFPAELRTSFWTQFPRLQGYAYGNLMRHCVWPKEAIGLANAGEYGWDGWLGTAFFNDPTTQTILLLMMQRVPGQAVTAVPRIKNALWSALAE